MFSVALSAAAYAAYSSNSTGTSFPATSPVANVTGKSPTSYEEVGDVANKSAGKLRGNWSQWNLSLRIREYSI